MSKFKIGDRVVGKQNAEAKCLPSDTFDFTTGAGLAFDRLMGREKAQDKQEAASPLIVKLYCVKASIGHYRFEKAKVYECKNGCIYASDGGFTCYTLDWFKDHFVPLVARPAKVGEWVYMVQERYDGAVIEGQIYQVRDIYHANGFGVSGQYPACDDGLWCVRSRDYLVLDGYKPEPEEKHDCANCANWRSK